MSATYTMKEIWERERIVFEKIPGMDQILRTRGAEKENLFAQYPDAVFALMVANSLFGRDREQCAIHQAAYFAILNGEDIADVRFRYDNVMKKYVERHLWDD